jgi:Fic family protein
MFKPRYTLTEALLTNMSVIERLYGQLETLRLPKELQLNLERNNLVTSTYISNSIEGNPLTLPEVTNLLLGDRVPTNRNEKEIRNYFDILKNLDQYSQGSLSLDTILAIHRKLLTGVKPDIAGIIRNKPVAVGSYYYEGGIRKLKIQHEPPHHTQQEIRVHVNALLAWMEQSHLPTPLLAGILHHQFVYIHPFGNGNGRTCRILTVLLFLQKHYSINKYFVLDDYYDIDRLQYSEKLHTADSGDKTMWLEYFTDGIKFSLQGALAKAKGALSTVSISKQPTPREKDVLYLFQAHQEVSSAMVGANLRVTRQQAHKLLQALEKRGFVKKIGSTKASYYVLS